MNARIVRALGWGLIDLKYEHGSIVDPRINSSCVLLPTNADRFDARALMDVYRSKLDPGMYAKEEYQRHVEFINSLPDDFNLSNFFTFEPDVCDSILLLTPATNFYTHKRQGDFIDTATALEYHGNSDLMLTSSATILDQAPSLYTSTYLDKVTQRALDTKLAHAWRFAYLQGIALASYCKDKGGADGHEEFRLNKLQDELKKCTTKLGFDTVEEALYRIWVPIPPELLFMINYSSLFTDPRAVFDLVPMVYEINYPQEEGTYYRFIWKNHIPRRQ